LTTEGKSFCQTRLRREEFVDGMQIVCCGKYPFGI